MMESFVDRLRAACDATESLVCVGLDVDPERIPASVFTGDRTNPRYRARACVRFNKAIVDATRDLVCAYKPNLAFYEAEGVHGILALQQTIQYIRKVAPHAVIIGDSKMGDIGETAAAYAKAMFDVLEVDAVTINAYGGHDTAAPWFAKPERGAFIWCRGSNEGSADFQDLKVFNEEEPLERMYVRMARVSQHWTEYDNLGLVMGATAPNQIAKARRSCPDVPFLIPGVGAQNGDVASAVRNGVNGEGRMAIINSSRGVIYASSEKDFDEAARKATKVLRKQINSTLDDMGLGWNAPIK